MNDCSCVMVDKDQTIKSCRKAIKGVMMSRKHKFQRDVKRIMSKRKGFFQNGDYPTRKEAINQVEHTRCGVTGMIWWRVPGWGTLKDAKQLLAACSVCVCEEIGLTIEQAAFVAKWS